MSSECTLLCLIILVVYPLWGCLGYFVARRRYQVLWEPTRYHDIRCPKSALAEYWNHRAMWLCLIAISACQLRAMTRAGAASQMWFVPVCCVPVVADVVIALHFARKEHRAAGREGVFRYKDWARSANDPLWAARIVSVGVVVVALQAPGPVLVAIACVSGFRCAITGKRYPMEETPLLDEFRSIADFFDKSVSKVLLVVPDEKSVRRPRFSTSVGRRTGTGDVCHHIPLQSFQTLRPSTLSAAYALDYSGMGISCLSGYLLLVLMGVGWCVFALVLSGLFTVLTNDLGLQYACDEPFIRDVAGGVVIAVAITAKHAMAYRGPMEPVEYHNAYGAWMDADGDGTRSVEDFVEALAEDLSFRRKIYNRDVLWLFLMRNPGVLALLCENEMDPESVIREAANRAPLAYVVPPATTA